MKKYFAKIKTYIVTHKVLSTVALIAVLLLLFWGYRKATSTAGDTRYITSQVEMGTIVASVTATGQVSAESLIDLKPKASGEVTYIGGKNGEKVRTGALIAKLDTRDAESSVRSALQNLESAQISLAKLKIENSEANMTAEQKKAYADGLSTVSDTFLDLPNIVNGLEDLLAEDDLSYNNTAKAGKIATALRNKAETSFYAIQKTLNKNKKDYILLHSNSPAGDIEKIIKETYETNKELSDAVKNMLDFVNYMADDSDTNSFVSAQTTLSTYTGTAASHLSELTSAQTNIDNNKDSSQNASLDLRSAELSVEEKQDALQDAKANLSDYFIRAPYAGIITNMNIKKGDLAGGSTVVATLITDKQLAEVSMNEVDVAKIKTGEKATLAFDAVPEVTISGVVDEIDSIGTVSQGVVTYNVKITFDNQDERVKPGMSVSAKIVTDTKENVVVVPNSAIKSQGGKSYIEILDSSKNVPVKIPVEVGLANDSRSEIISGINEGEEIITRTILPSALKPATPAPSLFGGGGPRNGTRIPTGK